MVPNLLGGKLLTGVLPLEKQETVEPWFPLHSPILDIESCIDDPTLAPLGGHIRQQQQQQKQYKNKPIKIKKKEKETNKKNGQVKIQRNYEWLLNNKSGEGKSGGLLMLRRKNLTVDELADHLNTLMKKPSTLNSYLQNHQLKKFNYFDNLVELDISRNKLTHLPPEITFLHQLRTLNASSNLLTDIPKELYHMIHLQVLILSQNQLHIIPDELPLKLPLLMTLSVAGNMIDYLTPNIDQWKFMKHLQLGSVFGGNRLTCLPDTIANMDQLQELDISHNQLSILPSNMLIPSLLHLNASRNQLDSLPSSIGQCHQLKTLNVSSNHLTTLPADLANLQNLELLDISENLLCIMPADILERMKTTLLITGNPLTRPGHCDIYNSTDAYAQVLKRMTMRAVPMMTSLSNTSNHSTNNHSISSNTTATTNTTTTSFSHHQCGPYGTGCLGITSSPSTSTTFTNLQNIPTSPIPSTSTSSTSSTSSNHHHHHHHHHPSKNNYILKCESSSSAMISSPLSNSPTTRSSQLWYGDNDDDSLIDRELSYLAQQLNVQGSKRDRQLSNNDINHTNPIVATSPLMIPTTPILSPRLRNEDVLLTELPDAASMTNSPTLSRSYSPFDEDMFFSRSLLMDSSPSISSTTQQHGQLLDLDRDQENASPITNDQCTLINSNESLSPNVIANTNIVHSLRELATRVILNSKIKYPLHMIPPHLAKDLSKAPRWCAHCKKAFVNEWLTSVEIKSYRSHPAVVRRVRFCTTKCWQLYLHSKKSMVCVHRADSQTIERESADQEESEFLQASLLADMN